MKLKPNYQSSKDQNVARQKQLKLTKEFKKRMKVVKNQGGVPDIMSKVNQQKQQQMAQQQQMEMRFKSEVSRWAMAEGIEYSKDNFGQSSIQQSESAFGYSDKLMQFVFHGEDTINNLMTRLDVMKACIGVMNSIEEDMEFAEYHLDQWKNRGKKQIVE